MSTNKQRFWQQHIDNWQASGLSGPVFCLQHDLPYHRFSYWRRKLTQDNTSDSNSAFAQVLCTSNRANPLAGVSLALPNGIEIRDIESHNIPVVKALLGVCYE